MADQITLPPPPAALAEVPHRRYWGDRQPPKNRSDMFSTSIRSAAAAGDAPSSSGETSTSGSVATMRIYGPIDSWGGFWGISAGDVSAALDTIGPDISEIRVRINSPGGEMFEGLTILNMLRAHGAHVVAVVDGLAASAASFIAAGCDETVMSPGTQMMIHDVSSFAWGNAGDMRAAAASLDSSSNAVASLYAEAAGGTEEQWRALMVAETWYTATEAAAAGLAARVGVVTDAGDTATAGKPDDPLASDPFEDRFDLSIFNYAGRANAPGPKPPTASADGSITTPEGGSDVAFSDEQITNLRRTLGVAEDADETTIMAALTEALAERADDPQPVNTNVPAGHVVIPEVRLRDLEAAAQVGVGAANRLHDQERDAFLNANKTKFLPKNRSAWAKEYDRDPEATREHFETAPVLIPVDELGYGDKEPEATSAADKSYNAIYPTKEA